MMESPACHVGDSNQSGDPLEVLAALLTGEWFAAPRDRIDMTRH